MTIGHTRGTLICMTAKVTLSFSEETIADARQFAEREGISLSAWINQAAREKVLRVVFAAHAEVVKRAGVDLDAAALADEHEIEMVDRVMFRDRGRPGAA